MKTLMQVVLVTLAAAVAMYAADPWVGTWKLNPAKSKSTFTNSVKTRTDKFEAMPDGSLKQTRTETRADGTTLNGTTVFKLDGKEYPATGFLWDSISAKRLSDNSYQTVVKKKGGPLNQTSVNTFSADGKTRTTVTKGTDQTGKSGEATQVYDKQ